MQRERKKGFTYSAILHIVLLLLAIFGLPLLITPLPPEEPAAVTVELLPFAAKSNVRPSEETPKETKQEAAKPTPPKPPQPTPPKPTPPKPAPPTPPAKTADSTPPPPEPKKEEKPEEKKPEPVKEEKKPEPKKEEKKPEPKQPEKKPDEKKKPKEDDLDKILKSVKLNSEDSKEKPDPKAKPSASAESAKEDAKKDASSKKARSNSFNPNSPEAISARDAISNQVRGCWSPPAGIRDASQMIVFVAIQYNEKAEAIKVELTSESRARLNEPGFRAAAESAIRAVKMCSPLKNMPADTYHIWQDVEIRFDPKDLL